MALYPEPGEYRSTATSVLGPDGMPWQKAAGVDPFDVPHVFMFNGIVGGSWRTYYHGQYDTAIRNDPEFAQNMRNDPHLMALLQERQMATATKKWEVQVGDQRDPIHRSIRDSIQKVIEETPRFMQMSTYLLEAIWFGRYAAELEWVDKNMLVGDPDDPRKQVVRPVPVIKAHIPVDGDKIGHHHDGTPYIQVNGVRANEVPNADITNATDSRGILLRGTFRRKFIMHMHQALDANFRTPEAADSIHGVGVRSFLFWLAWLKKELLSNILEYCERTGLGLRVWYYQGGNPKSEAEVKAAASEQTDRTNVCVPRFPGMGGRSNEGVEFVDTGSSGAMMLMSILDRFDAWTERYVVGQTLSSGTEGSGLGGSGVADLHADTKFQLTSYDAVNLSETYTMDLVRPLLGWMFPKFKHLPCKFQYTLVTPNPIESLNAIAAAYGMGVDFVKDKVREVVGQPAPQEGDDVISQAQAMQEAAQMQQQMMPQQGAAPGGQPGGHDEGDINEVMKQLMGGNEPKGGDGASEADTVDSQDLAMV